jgi:hypothetical protein
MTDAPERIWAAYPTSGNRVDQTIYGYGIEPFGPNDETWIDDDFDDPCMVAEYTRTDISQARIAELEALLKLITDRAEMSIGYNDDFFNFEWIVKKARAALKPKP